MVNNSIIREDRLKGAVPVLSRLQNTERSRQENQEKPQRAVPSFFVVFDDDEVMIASKKRSDNYAQSSKIPARVAEDPGTISESRSVVYDLAAAKTVAVSPTSEAVRSAISLGPYDCEVNQYAMKRYQEAGSLRALHTSTFEITA